MFTGIVEELGEVTAVEELGDASRFRLRGPLVTERGVVLVNKLCVLSTRLFEASPEPIPEI